ncbi:MAG: GtrA family protein [Rudaea sp.]|nr:GtrA family protein [Rudaea sp.]
MKILGDGARFIGVGSIQVVVDSAIYIVLTQLGLATLSANICGRCAGALLGFGLNGSVTFARNDQPHLRLRFVRYVILWLSLTAISTAALLWIAADAGLTRTWWCKPLIECALGMISFLLSRHWVYRR